MAQSRLGEKVPHRDRPAHGGGRPTESRRLFGPVTSQMSPRLWQRFERQGYPSRRSDPSSPGHTRRTSTVAVPPIRTMASTEVGSSGTALQSASRDKSDRDPDPDPFLVVSKPVEKAAVSASLHPIAIATSTSTARLVASQTGQRPAPAAATSRSRCGSTPVADSVMRIAIE